MSEKVILCVDDEKIVLDSLLRQLETKYGPEFLYETAENANDADEIIDELISEGKRILIIVTDWLMPGTKGDEFLIRLHQKYPHIVKIMLTGHADMSAIENATRKADLHRFIHKPWSENELFDAINSGLKKL
jgi:FixJ family two-component response regulator